MEKKYSVGGMTCSACSLGIEKCLNNLDGVTAANVSLMDKSMTVTFDENKVSEDEIFRAVTKLGYTVSNYAVKREKDNQAQKLKKRFIISLILLLPLMYFSMGEMLKFPLPNLKVCLIVQFVLAVLIIAINFKFFSNGVRALINKAPNMDTLVALASSVAFIYSVVITVFLFVGKDVDNMVFYESSAMVLTLVTLGKFLEELCKDKTGAEIDKLVQFIPSTVSVLKDGKEVKVSLSEVKYGDAVILRAGEHIAIDGVVAEGTAFIDNSVITGESLPVEVQEGSTVTSGGLVKNGYVVVTAQKVGEDTVFSKIISSVKNAAASKAPVQKFADKVAGIFVPIVTAIAIITFIVWILVTKDLYKSFNFAVSVLVISCPCALGLATPVAVMAAAGKGAKFGVLFKNAESIETLSKVNLVVLDKTATLTEGNLKVVGFENLSNLTDSEIKGLVYQIESMTDHPLAAAIKEFCGLENTTLTASEYNYEIGKGATCKIDGIRYYLGNAALLKFSVDKSYEEKYSGKTVIYFASAEKLLAVFVVYDTIKKDAYFAVKDLKALNIKAVMITGDNYGSAKLVKEELLLDDYKAGVLPDGKADAVNEYMTSGNVVAMVGDGINDSPALKTADVGIAMGSGTDIAIDTADAVLVGGKISSLTDALKISKKAFKIIKGNLFWAFFYNVLAIPVAAGVFAFLGIKLTPSISALCMSLSSLFVVTNALRINKYNNKKENDMFFKKESGTILSVEGMMCNHCKQRVEDAVTSVSGVKSVKVDLKKKSVFYTGEADVESVKQKITDAGYTVTDAKIVK